jgi:hypothetical protein
VLGRLKGGGCGATEIWEKNGDGLRRLAYPNEGAAARCGERVSVQPSYRRGALGVQGHGGGAQHRGAK